MVTGERISYPEDMLPDPMTHRTDREDMLPK